MTSLSFGKRSLEKRFQRPQSQPLDCETASGSRQMLQNDVKRAEIMLQNDSKICNVKKCN